MEDTLSRGGEGDSEAAETTASEEHTEQSSIGLQTEVASLSSFLEGPPPKQQSPPPSQASASSSNSNSGSSSSSSSNNSSGGAASSSVSITTTEDTIASMLEQDVIPVKKLAEQVFLWGVPEAPGMRMIVWKLLLNYFPAKRAEWPSFQAGTYR